jgi:peptidoglycan/xylan/chitin deacetylase (PgdA/CDA1 family)
MPLSPESTPSLLTPSVKKWADDRLTRLSVADPTIALRDLLTGQLSLRRELFNGTGKFDPQFTESGSFGNEDIDFGSRLLGEKHRILFNPRAITWQHYEVDLRTYLRRARETGQADVRLARKHPDQQHAIFQYTNGGKWINRFLWRHAVNLPFPVAPLTRFIDWLALKVADSGHQGPLAAKLIGWSSAIQYWRGIRASGGIPRPRMLRVLAYHAIADLAGMPILEDYGVPPKTFTNQLNTLERAGFNFICPEQFVRCLKDGAELPARALLLTFDDCYSDLLESASSILLEKKIPALAFAVSRCLGGNNAWDQDTGAPLRPLMTAAQLQELSKLGVEIGAHSRTHPFLTRESDQRLVAELCGSIDDLEATGLKRPRFLAYPFGDHDERVRNTARDANIAAAFTVTPGVFQAGDDPLRVPRIEIMRNDTGLKLLWKIGIAPVFRTKTRKAMTKKKRAP